jgi:hypothetical protein
LSIPDGGGVARLPPGDRPDPGQADVGKGLEIRLADLQVDNLPSLSFQGLGARQHGVRSFSLQSHHTLGKAGHLASCFRVTTDVVTTILRLFCSDDVSRHPPPD